MCIFAVYFNGAFTPCLVSQLTILQLPRKCGGKEWLHLKMLCKQLHFQEVPLGKSNDPGKASFFSSLSLPLLPAVSWGSWLCADLETRVRGRHQRNTGGSAACRGERATESRDCQGRKGALETAYSNPLTQAGPFGVGDTGTRPGRFGMSPEREIPQTSQGSLPPST